MKDYFASFSLALALATFSSTALARPSVSYICQTQDKGYSQIKVCAERWDSHTENRSFGVLYSGGLLNKSPDIYLKGSVTDCMGRSSNINVLGLAMYPGKPNDVYYGINGGCSNTRLEFYFVTPDGQFDSQYGQNYIFNF